MHADHSDLYVTGAAGELITDALAYLFGLERLGMKFGLENISMLCEALGHPQRTFDSILIAGTNGKGSVTAMVHQALVAAGHHAGRYTSPHLERLEERFVIGSRQVEPGALREAAEVVRQAITGLQQAGRLEAPPTFFEAATAIGFELFRRAAVRVAVLEVGLGGRLDATNVVTPIAAAITSIDFDHQAQLGQTLEAIAFEKAGIIKPGIAVVCGPLPEVAEAVVRQVCSTQSAQFVSASNGAAALELTDGSIALRGAHQLDNARVAVRLLREIDARGIRIADLAIRTGLSTVEWPGRLERFEVGDKSVLVDAAHNPAGARALALYLRQIGWTECVAVFGVMQDKDARAMLAELAPVCAALICTTPDTPRSLDAGALAGIAATLPSATWTIETVPQPSKALAHALRSHARVVAAGSIFLIGPLRGILRAQ